MIVALCGGVGGSKLVAGLYRVVAPDELVVIVNTADDLQVCGLHVSPDVDTVTYTLAGIARRDVGWGIEGDTFNALSMLERLGAPSWFQIGDLDLATDVFRTQAVRQGQPLSDVTRVISRALGVRAEIVPMTDGSVATRLLVKGEWIDFQDYFVRRQHRVEVEDVRYDGVADVVASDHALNRIEAAEVVVIVNSNPVLSILPILAVPGVRDAVRSAAAPRVAVSPIIGSDAVTGPAGDLMRLIDRPSTAAGVADTYLDIIDGIVIDQEDEEWASAIESMGVSVLCTQTLMRTEDDRARLAAETLSFARGIR